MECGRPGLVIIVVLAYGVRMAVAIWPGLSSRFCWFCPCWVKVHGKRVVGVTVAQKETGDDLSCQRRPPCRCPEEWRWVWATCRLYLPSPEQPQRGIGRMCRHRLGVEREKSPTACPALDGSKLGFSEPLISSRGFCFAERRKQRLGMVGCCGVTAAWGGRLQPSLPMK